MKQTLIFALLTIASTFAVAKGGGSKPMTPERFIHESIEDSMVLAKNSGAGTILFTSATVVDTETVTISINDTLGGAFEFQCVLVDDVSQSGTVVKKDVRCLAQ